MPGYFGFEAVGALILNPGDPENKEKGAVLFTDQDAHDTEDKAEADHDASDDEDDARLTSNVKTANEMPLPRKKNDEEEEAKTKKSNVRRKKGEKAGDDEASEPINTAERLEHLHLMQEKKFINFPCNSGLSG